MVGMMTELGMEWSAAIYLGTNKLQVGVNRQHNADAMESGIVAMAPLWACSSRERGLEPRLGMGRAMTQCLMAWRPRLGVWK